MRAKSTQEIETKLTAHVKQSVNMQERLKSIVEKWAPIVGELGWTLVPIWVGLHADMPEGTEKNANAIVFCDWKYLKASIYFSLENLVYEDTGRIEWSVVHEIVHCLVEPLLEAAPGIPSHMVEHTVSAITNAMLCAERIGESK